MTGSHNLALLSSEKRRAMQADLLACRIRWECRNLGEQEKKAAGRQLLAKVPAGLRVAVVEQLRRRSSM